MVERALAGLEPGSHDHAVRIACLPEVVRGYEAVKLRNIQRFREAAQSLGA
jgi:indolepyruvate ferredoxin oxidoreductase